MQTRDVESLTNSAVQAVLKEFRKNEIPAPWGKAYTKLRYDIRRNVEATLEAS